MAKLYVICGESGAGKTLIANRLARETGMVYIEADTIEELISDDALYGISVEVSQKLMDIREKVVLRLCMENLRVGNSVILVTQRYTKYEEWEEAVRKNGVNLLGGVVDFYIISRKDEEKHKDLNSAYHFINSSNINLDDVKSLMGM